MSAHWSLGVLIGLPLAGVALLVALVMLGISIYLEVDEGDALSYIAGSAGVVLVILVGTGLAMFPFHTEYHRWTPTSGTIAQISSRLLTTGSGDSRSVNQRFVVGFADGRQRSCDDTRCSLIKVGDHLDLSCKRAWQWAATPGWDCNYIGRNGSAA